MKRFHLLISAFLFAGLACSLVPEVVPASTPTSSRSFFASPIPGTPAPPTRPPTLADADVTAAPQPSATVSPMAASALPAVAHHQPNDAVTLDTIRMIDALNGWAISGASVLFTADGAQTWREATPPEALISGSHVQAQGTFLDAERAWVLFSFDNQVPASAVVWHTSDGGRTWIPGAPLEHQAYGEHVWAEFSVLDESHLWLMMRGVYAGAGIHYAAQFLRSTDGGLTWLPLISNGNFDYNYDYTGLVFADPDHGLAAWQTTGAYAPAPPEYAVTADGADTWEVRQLPPPSDAPDVFDTSAYCEPFQPHILSNQSLRLLVGCFDIHDPPQEFSSYFYSSEDGGKTWSSMPLAEKVLANQAALFFFDEENALLLGRDIYRSADGGQTWEYVKSVTWDAQFSFVDPQTGWAIARANGESALVKTSNGGALWTEIKPVIAP